VLSEAQLRDLAHGIAAWRNGTIAIDFAGERILFDDMLQRVYTDDGRGNGRLTEQGLDMLPEPLDFNPQTREPVRWEKLFGPGLAALVGSRRDNHELFNSHLDEMIASHQGPPWTWDRDAIEASNTRLHRVFDTATGRMRYLVAGIMLPPVGALFSSAAERAVQERDATEVAIALVLWYRKHAAWPDKLDQLVPDLLPAVPPDRFDGQPLRYAVRDGKPVVYSIGRDRDDDGGRPTEAPEYAFSNYEPLDPNTKKHHQTYDGDWVLWPPPPGPAEPEPAE